MTGDVVHFERGKLFHVTEPWSLFAGGVAPIGFNCVGAGCPECQRGELQAMTAPRCTVVRVDREAGVLTVEPSAIAAAKTLAAQGPAPEVIFWPGGVIDTRKPLGCSDCGRQDGRHNSRCQQRPS